MKTYAKSFYLPALTALLAFAAVIIGPVSTVLALTGAISLSVSSGAVGSTVSLTGSGFTVGSSYSIRFASTVVKSGTVATGGSIADSFTVPSSPRGSYQVTVTTSSDNSSIANFGITPVITLDTVSGRAGNQVKVTGSGFTASSSVTILFDSTTVGTITASSTGAFTSVAITIPTAAAGSHAITASDSAGASPAVTFDMNVASVSFSENSGYIGSQIKVSGSGFLPDASVAILFDTTSMGTATTGSSGAFTDVTVSVPPGVAGNHKVAGKDTIGTSPEVGFSILPPSISLAQSSSKVGDQIMAGGLGFVPNASVSVLMDGTSFGSVTADAGGKFANAPITVPSGSRGKHTITAKDTSNTSAGVTFELNQSLVMNPASGTAGSTVTVNGYGFTRSSAVTLDFDGNTQALGATTDAAGSFSGNYQVPEAVGGEHIIRVRDNAGSEATAAFTVVASLTISPDSGPSGTVVKVNGVGFKADAPVIIKFNGAPVVTNPEGIQAGFLGSFSAAFEVPPSLAGSYLVEASDGTSRAGDQFASVLAAAISQITSETAPGYIGMPLTIKGAGFSPNAKVMVMQVTVHEPIASVITSADGVFSVDFVMPPASGGQNTITVTDGAITQDFPVFIEQEPPPVPTLLKPEADTKAASPAIFQWKDVTDVSGVTYTIQIAADEQFNRLLVQEEGLAKPEFVLPKHALKAVTRQHPYYWRVKAVDGASNQNDWSEPRSFSNGFLLTLPDGEPELILPAMWVYGLIVGAIALIILGFFAGRKTAWRFAPVRPPTILTTISSSEKPRLLPPPEY